MVSEEDKAALAREAEANAEAQRTLIHSLIVVAIIILFVATLMFLFAS